MFARKTLATPSADTYTRVAFFVNSWGTQAALIRLRDASAVSIGNVYLSNIGHVGFHVDVAGSTNTQGITTSTTAGPGWHALELHLAVNGASSALEVWLDGALVSGLPANVDLVASGPVAIFQIGDSAANSNDILYDDAAYGTSRFGPVSDSTAPSVPGGLAATPAAFSVALTWTASTDDVAIGGYDVYRGGTLVASLGNVTTYTDTSVLASTTYSYTVRARDTSGNPSAQSAALPVTTLAPAAPVFADGFESGDFSAWTTSGGLTIEGTNVRTGSFAAQGVGPVFARKTLSTPSADAYSRVAFFVNSGVNQAALIRLKDATGASIGDVFLSSTGRIGFRNDFLGTGATSYTSLTVPSSGAWHVLELHLASEWVVLHAGGLARRRPRRQPPGHGRPRARRAGRPVPDRRHRASPMATTSCMTTRPSGRPVSGRAPTAPRRRCPVALRPLLRRSPSCSPGTRQRTTSASAATTSTAVARSWQASATSRATPIRPSWHRPAYSYTVRARDTSGNPSAQSAPYPVTTLASAAPVFADGFESGDLSAWTTTAGLAIEGSTVHGGANAAEGNATGAGPYAKKTLPSTYADGYARVWFQVVNQTSQVNLLRLRDAADASIGFAYHRNDRPARLPQRRSRHERPERHDPGTRLARPRAPRPDRWSERHGRALARQRADH